MVQGQIQIIIETAIRAAQSAGALPDTALPEVVVEQPQRPEHGDFATPVALGLARPLRRAPREIAQAIVAHIPANDLMAAAEVAGPGYVNMRLRSDWLASQVDLVLARGEHYADQDLGRGRRAQVEFVSANPTGPLTVGHGRNAVLGDTLANVLAAMGWRVTREYYFNDGGLQMKNLAESVRLRALQALGQAVEFPESYYQGEYISEIAHALVAEHGSGLIERDWIFFRDHAVAAIFADIRRTQAQLGIHFDVYTNEMTFFDTTQPGNIWDVLERLRSIGAIYEENEAIWFKATEFGADKDRVLLRSAAASIFGTLRAIQARLGIPFEPYPNERKGAFYERDRPTNVWKALDELRAQNLVYEANGTIWFRATRYGAPQDLLLWNRDSRPDPTYRLPDIAYHLNKLDRGFDLVVDVLGADHIDQFPDIRAAMNALGHDASRIQVLSYQFVTLLRHGQVVKMSTRKANYVTLDELIDEVGADAVRFFMLMRSSESPIEFDLDLAKRQSDDNPVFYVQYAHARTAGILDRMAPARGIVFDTAADVTLLKHPSELALIKEILRLSEVLKGGATRFELHQLAFYARDLASAFNAFYRDCRVLDAEDAALVGARLKLVKAARIGLARALGLMGMSAPEQM
jgi:arginyl-tRNA synthetase